MLGVYIGIHRSLGVHLICPLHLHKFFLCDQIVTFENAHGFVAWNCHYFKIVIPETDAFFRLLYALGTVGSSPLENITVYNPDDSGAVDKRFREMLGPGAIARYKYKQMLFHDAISDAKVLFPARKR